MEKTQQIDRGWLFGYNVTRDDEPKICQANEVTFPTFNRERENAEPLSSSKYMAP